MATHQAEVAVRQQVSRKSDEYYGDTEQLGRLAWSIFGEKSKSQIRNLENVANSSASIADILDFIKRQTGRSRQWRHENFGQKLLERIREPLRADAEAILDAVKGRVEKHGIESDDLRRTHILLCREFVRHLSAHYSYSVGVLSRQSRGKHHE